MGGTTQDELEYSNGPTRICGQDETEAVDVFQRGDGKNAMAVDAFVNIQNNIPPALDKHYRIDWTNTTVAYGASANYQTIWSYSGSGYLHSFHIDFNTDRHQIQLEIDGQVIFTDLGGKILADIGYKAAGAPPIIFGNRSGATTSDNSDFDFSPHADIKFTSSVVIKARKNDATAFSVLDWIVHITKLT